MMHWSANFAKAAFACLAISNSLAFASPMQVCKEGDQPMEELIDPNVINKAFATAPEVFRLLGKSQRQQLLVALESGVDPNVCGPGGLTPLMIATAGGDMSTVRLLLAHGANVNAPVSESGWSPVLHAIAAGHIDLARYLVESGADPTQSAGEMNSLLLLAGVSTNGATDLENSIANLAKLMISRGAKADVRLSSTGATPLIVATAANHIDLVRVLIEFGADACAKKKNGDTALKIARARGSEELQRILGTCE
jgi:ankyrin repeat protein